MLILFLQLYSSTPTPSYTSIARHLRGDKDSVWVGSLNDVGYLEWKDGENTVAVQHGPINPPKFLRRVPILSGLIQRAAFIPFVIRVSRFIHASNPNIVQVNPASMYFVAFFSLLGPKKCRFVLDFRQIQFQKHNNFLRNFHFQFMNWTNRWNAKYVYNYACFVHPLAAKFLLGSNWKRFSAVVPHGVPPSFIAQPRASIVSRKSRVVIFVYIGTLSRVRKLELILNSVQRLLDESGEFRVVFIGPDSAFGYYQQLARKLNLTTHVEFSSPVAHEQIPELLSNYDVALAYTPNEPLDWYVQPTLKVSEYRALGLPIIATDTPPNRDVVVHEVDGLFVDHSIESISTAMLRFIDDQEFFKKCHNNAQQKRAVKTWKEIAELYRSEVYQLLQ